MRRGWSVECVDPSVVMVTEGWYAFADGCRAGVLDRKMGATVLGAGLKEMESLGR
jgi:hypothetical protein